MYFATPYAIALVIAVIAILKGENPRKLLFWHQIGLALALMLIMRDLYFLVVV